MRFFFAPRVVSPPPRGVAVPSATPLPPDGEPPGRAVAREARKTAYRYDENHNTDMLAIRSERSGLLCLDCSILLHFGGSLAALEAVDYGQDVSGRDSEGYPYTIVNHANVERDPAFQEQAGRLTCAHEVCQREIYNHEQYR